MNLLLDVDGVLRFKNVSHEDKLLADIGWTGDFQKFQWALFGDPDYRKTLTGEHDFILLLARLMNDWGIGADASEFYHAWLMADARLNQDLLDTVAQLGFDQLCLATNQEPVRGSFIRNCYETHPAIDRVFISCELGVAKPAPAYFLAILNKLGCAADQTIFVDDYSPNVDTAASLGIHSFVYQSNSHLLAQLGKLS